VYTPWYARPWFYPHANVVVTNGFHPQPVVHTPLGPNTGFGPSHTVSHNPLGSVTGTGHGHRR
jgi:hypothetical protein